MKKKVTTYQICILAFCVIMNIIGGQIALFLRLPIYLDSIGTVLAASLFGPLYGMLPSLLSGLIMGINDVYSIYYAPVGILFGCLCGFVWKKEKSSLIWPFVAAFFVTIPSSFVSACITAYLFGGITSSGSTVLVQLLAQTPLGLTVSCFLVQLLTDYADRVVAFWITILMRKRLSIDHQNRKGIR